jgi:RNA polymerase sigma-70 factor (ECF subfamily)
MKTNSEGLEKGQQTIHKYLIERCWKNDRRAQNELYKLYAGAMYNIARRMMGDEEEARDVMQDAFVHAFMKLRSLKDPALFSAWIKRIVINHCINALKKKKLDQEPLEEKHDHQDPEDNDSEEFIQYGMRRIVEAMDQISEGCRTVLNLYVFEGYDHQEISEILSISTSASKAQLSKAKTRIRNLIENQPQHNHG